MMTRAEAQQLLREVLVELRQVRPGMRLDAIAELFDVGELRVGLEILCDNVLELDVPLTAASKENIAKVASFLQVPASCWNDILVAPESHLDG
jgi:hypothetical protein